MNSLLRWWRSDQLDRKVRALYGMRRLHAVPAHPVGSVASIEGLSREQLEQGAYYLLPAGVSVDRALRDVREHRGRRRQHVVPWGLVGALFGALAWLVWASVQPGAVFW